MADSARSIVIVVGMHRSGTSLCSHLLTRLGYDMGAEQDAHPSNAKGHWERSKLVALHDRILRHFNRDYYTPSHAFSLPAGWWTDPEVQKIRAEIVAWLREHMGQRSNFGFKDPRTSLILPLWNEILAELDLKPKYVFCIRDPSQVIRSITERDKFDPSDSEYRWVRYNAHAIAGIGNDEAAFIPYEAWFTDPSANLNRLIGSLGSSWSPNDPTLLEAVGDVIAPELRHDANSSRILRPFTRTLHRLVIDSMPSGRPNAELLDTARHFIEIEQLHSYKQTAFAELARDHNAQKATMEALKKTEMERQTELQSLKTTLEQERAALAAARQEIERLGPPPPVQAPPSAPPPAADAPNTAAA